jgi:hypothetical protein
LEILTSRLFNEVDSYFLINHKVDLKIREKLNECIKSDLQLTAKENGMCFLNLIISTNKTTFNVEVKGPDINRKDKFINWGLWLPYEDIANSENQVLPYLKYYFDALIVVFKYYGINEVRLREIEKSVENEIIGNSEYDYEEDIIDLDLSDLDLN